MFSRATRIDPAQMKVGFDEGMLDLDQPIAAPESNTDDLPGAIPEPAAAGDDLTPWSAEIFLSWQALGLPGAPATLRADVGIRSADSTGKSLGDRIQWADPDTRQVADPAFSTAISPMSWGNVWFK